MPALRADDRAFRIHSDYVNSVVGWASIRSRCGRAEGLVGQILHVDAELIPSHCRSVRSTVVDRPCVLGAVNQPQIVLARASLCVFPGFHECRYRDRRKQSDDCHNDHDFHQRETSFPVHNALLIWVCHHCQQHEHYSNCHASFEMSVIIL